jgi:anti-sigma-K factor RskA
MPRTKGHPEFQHLDDAEYRRAVNRVNAANCYRRKQIARLREKLARLEAEHEEAAPRSAATSSDEGDPLDAK